MALVVAAAVPTVFADNATVPKPPPGVTVLKSGVWISAATFKAPRPDPPPCRGANRAINFYRQAYTASRTTMGLAGAVPRRWWGCTSARRRSVEWRGKAHQARVALARWEYAWEEWLPANWYRVGSCETGYGGDPNFRHANGSFVSAFGITRVNYAHDAAVAGTPQWNDAHPPTPREQYLTALAHYRMHGDGWGCPGP